ncbi:unnamed protein product, partial [Mesorhabditis belari]|uniref:DNA polymerase epsilon subunit n=1 Tax=Mesorhabditis belari TaxID=2138241 RepID=A0AAF3J6M5_9BILA
MDDTIERRLIRKLIGDTFRMNALMLKKDAQEFCIDTLERVEEDKRRKWMERIIETIRKQNLTSDCVTLDDFQNIIKQVVTSKSEKATALIKIFDAFTLPYMEFCTEKKHMLVKERKTGGGVERMTAVFRQRFLQIQQRISRLNVFDGIKFTTVEGLLAVSHRIDEAVVLGMLTQQKANTWHIEDLTGSVQVEFTPDTKFHAGIFCEGAAMIFEGFYQALLFTVTGVGMVPPESAEQTRKACGNTNWFGGEEKLCFRANPKLIKLGSLHQDASIVVLSDVHLDDPLVLACLRHLFTGFISAPPAAFVFCGNFCSRSRQPDTMQLLDKGFRRLSDAINEYATYYANSHFIFVPGPDDPSSQYVLPRPHLPVSLFRYMQKVPNCSFGSNPVRIQFASSEIIVFREDVIEKMCRHAIRVPSDSKEVWSAAVHTILSQAHLSPLPMHIAPVLWNYDDALRLQPLPDNLIIADKFESFSKTVKDCKVVNPGSFYRTPHEFMVVYPLKDLVEPSHLGKVRTEDNSL